LAVDTEEMRPLVAAFMVRGMRVYALDGFARYALPEYHAGVLRTIDHVARYNAEVNDQERFYGVRHDIEPYLLPGFHGPNRATLLLGLLELTSASVGRAHAAGLVYGADIPFWYDAVSEDTHQRTTVRYGGVEKSVSEHLIDLVDDVAIMDYRTTPYGSDGTLRHGIGEIRYGKERGKSVFIALETHALPDEVLLDFRGPSEKKLPSSPQGALVVLAPAGDSVVSALLPIFPTPSEASEALSVWLDQNRIDAGSVRWWPLGRRAEVPASKITFAGQDPTHLNRVMDATAGEFGKYTSFAGFAIHHAESYRALILDPIHHSRK
jgi:hypothetical protein